MLSDPNDSTYRISGVQEYAQLSTLIVSTYDTLSYMYFYTFTVMTIFYPWKIWTLQGCHKLLAIHMGNVTILWQTDRHIS